MNTLGTGFPTQRQIVSDSSASARMKQREHRNLIDLSPDKILSSGGIIYELIYVSGMPISKVPNFFSKLLGGFLDFDLWADDPFPDILMLQLAMK